MNNQTWENQTEKYWISKSDWDDLGTAIYLEAGDDISDVESRKYMNPNITYSDAVRNIYNGFVVKVDYLKWVPNWYQTSGKKIEDEYEHLGQLL